MHKSGKKHMISMEDFLAEAYGVRENSNLADGLHDRFEFAADRQ